MQEGVWLPLVTWSQDGTHQLQGLGRGGGAERVERYGGKKGVHMNAFRNKDNSSIAFLKKEKAKRLQFGGRVFFFTVLSFLLSSKTGRYGRKMGIHAAKEQGQESNPGRCGKDWALLVRALPSEPPGLPGASRDRHAG